jgi:hypothetical protein
MKGEQFMTESTSPTAQAATIHLSPTASSPEGFFNDMEALKLSLQDAGLTDVTEEVLMRIPIRKPMKHEYFRVRPGAENCFTTILYEDRETREFYFVAPAMISKLRSIGDVSVATLVQFMTKQKVLGIFPLKMATDSNIRTGWQDTAFAAAELAKTYWIRMQADMALAGYRVLKAKGELSEPEWPATPFNELLDVAFKDRVINTEDHPVFNKLLGRS